MTRRERILELFPGEPAFRLKQLLTAIFQPTMKGWKDVTTLPKAMKEVLEREVPWMSIEPVTILKSARKDTYKAMIRLCDSKLVETVLMANRRGQWTICVSSQVGCAMACTFCATGKMGLTRSLTHDEIIDQYRFWQNFLLEHPELPQRISNVVFMGMGEPLANYENVRETLNTWLMYTDLGPTHIMVSTVGVLPRLTQILNDPKWPHVRIAVSLHSADSVTRKEIVPTSFDQFLEKLKEWGKAYLKKFGNRKHHLTFEYVMLSGVNDTPHHAKVLAKFVHSIGGDVKVNLIPYNFIGSVFQKSSESAIEKFMLILERARVTTMRRKTMGDDIAAACGQLITMNGD